MRTTNSVGQGHRVQVVRAFALMLGSVGVLGCTGSESSTKAVASGGSGATAGSSGGTSGTGGVGGVSGTGGTSAGSAGLGGTGGAGGAPTGGAGGVPTGGTGGVGVDGAGGSGGSTLEDASCDGAIGIGPDGAPIDVHEAIPDGGDAGKLLRGGPGCPPHLPNGFGAWPYTHHVQGTGYCDVYTDAPCVYELECQSGTKEIAMMQYPDPDPYAYACWQPIDECRPCLFSGTLPDCAPRNVVCADHPYDSCPGTALHCLDYSSAGWIWYAPGKNDASSEYLDCPPDRPAEGSLCTGIGLPTTGQKISAFAACGYHCTKGDTTSPWVVVSCQDPDSGTHLLGRDSTWVYGATCP